MQYIQTFTGNLTAYYRRQVGHVIVLVCLFFQGLLMELWTDLQKNCYQILLRQKNKNKD